MLLAHSLSVLVCRPFTLTPPPGTSSQRPIG